MPVFTSRRTNIVKKNSFLIALASSFLLLQILLSVGNVAAGGEKYYEPGRGSQERKAIMNAARVPISREIGQRVIFVVDVLRTDGRMAYLQATPVNPDSTPLNWNNTPFREDWSADMMSDVVMVLLERQGSSWKAMDYFIGPTDVAWYGWLEKYGLPQTLFYGG
ncbi:MAG: hypothetical protein GY761_02135 [Hyphomicrobiales bacterium]|nr:hypothetical protein [Hyphomicrobiales bacterium]